jgi:glycosyltransferase involved in cell wall biosynthesis
VGDGPESVRLRRLAGPSVRFTGRVSDAEVAELMRSCQALVVTAEEEFGIAAVEAQASGRPVIALGRGGVCETVVDGRTGCFYPEDRPEALIELLRGFDAGAYEPAACVANADRFSVARFHEALGATVQATLAADGDAPARPRLVHDAAA